MSPVSAPPLKLMPAPPTTSVKLPVMFGPNITGGTLWAESSYENPMTGCFYYAGNDLYGSGSTDKDNRGIYMNASRANAIYGRATTVQPSSMTVLFCIKF